MSIQWLKIICCNFLEVNRDFVINGYEMDDLVKDEENKSIIDFKSNAVFPFKINPTSVVPYILALLLRCKIEIHYINSQTFAKGIQFLEYKAEDDNYDFIFDDKLNFHKQSIKLLLRPGHYDLISDQRPDYDSEFRILEGDCVFFSYFGLDYR